MARPNRKVNYKTMGDSTKPSTLAEYVPRKKRWWACEEPMEATEAATAIIGMLNTDLNQRLSRYRTAVRLYGVNDQFATYFQTSRGSNKMVIPDRLSRNVVQSNVDTLTSKITKSLPRAKVLTTLGNYKAQQAAKKMTFLMDGIALENKLDALTRMAVRDAQVLADAFIMASAEQDRVKLERVLPNEIFVDELEAIRGKVTHAYRVKLVDREELMRQYPDKAEVIAYAASQFTSNTHPTSDISDLLEVCDAYHLPSSKMAKDGKHLVTLSGQPLLMEEWPLPYFPWARLSWTKPFAGYWSQSLPEQLKPTQLEINRILDVIQRSFHLMGAYKVLVANGSKITNQSINNAIGTVVNYTGVAPQYVTPPPVADQLFQQLDRLESGSYQISGVSALSATSMKPAGLNSGVALQEYAEIETERFHSFASDVQDFRMEVAGIALGVARMIAEKNGGSYPVTNPNSRGFNRIDLKEIALAEGDYTIGCFAASNLPRDPAGRLVVIDSLVARGLVDKSEERELLNMPDIEQVTSLSSAPVEWLHKVMDGMLEDGISAHPEREDDLQLARKMALQTLALGKKLGEPESRLQLIRDYLTEIDQLAPPEPAPAPTPELPPVV